MPQCFFQLYVDQITLLKIKSCLVEMLCELNQELAVNTGICCVVSIFDVVIDQPRAESGLFWILQEFADVTNSRSPKWSLDRVMGHEKVLSSI